MPMEKGLADFTTHVLCNNTRLLTVKVVCFIDGERRVIKLSFLIVWNCCGYSNVTLTLRLHRLHTFSNICLNTSIKVSPVLIKFISALTLSLAGDSTFYRLHVDDDAMQIEDEIEDYWNGRYL